MVHELENITSSRVRLVDWFEPESLNFGFQPSHFKAKPNPDIFRLSGEPFLAGIWVILLEEWVVISWRFGPTTQTLRRCFSLLLSCPEPWDQLWWETNTFSTTQNVWRQRTGFVTLGILITINNFRLVCFVTSENALLTNWGNTQNLTLAFWTLDLLQHFRKYLWFYFALLLCEWQQDGYV